MTSFRVVRGLILCWDIDNSEVFLDSLHFFQTNARTLPNSRPARWLSQPRRCVVHCNPFTRRHL